MATGRTTIQVARHNDRVDWGDTARLVQDCHHFNNDLASNVIVSPPKVDADQALRVNYEGLASVPSIENFGKVDKKRDGTVVLANQTGTLDMFYGSVR